ncbi:MAG TPA: FAD-dependent oxidoreductase [Baekduia sp.]|nr:FAD-dependent oxidoreductase [Baekduia sp.]
MSERFQHLFQPIQIGPVEVPNRICFSGHSSYYPIDGLPNDAHANYLAERAKGGAGWIVIGGGLVHESTLDSGGSFFVNERAIPAATKLVEQVHAAGAKISTQIDHWGSAAWYPRKHIYPLFAPSARVDTGGIEVPKAMELEDIEMVIQASERAAGVARAAGFDGVEFLCAMGFSLMQQFLSPRLNRRTDEYGGSLENRLRYPLQVIERVRAAAGPDMMVGVKIVADELAEGGIDEDESGLIVKALADSGNVDYLHVDVGSTGSRPVWMPEMDYPAGFAAPMAAQVREQVNIPVLAVNRITDPLLAEQLLADGQADLIAMARALIADAELPNKARDGRLDEIRQCTGSNQECVARTHHLLPVRCVHNPAVGEEHRFGIGSVTQADARRKVVVVGGGPAGMKAAELAAKRGHSVQLYERSDSLGGQVRFITAVNSRKDYESVTRYLTHQMGRLGVDVQLGREASADDIRAAGADAVVIATGAKGQRTGWSSSTPTRETMPGADEPHVKTVFDVFQDPDTIGQRVLIVDEFGDLEPTMIAEYLADLGRDVEIATRQPYVAVNMPDPYSFEPLASRLQERNVRWTGFIAVDSVAGGRATGSNEMTAEPFERDVDTVVLSMGKQADDDLYFALKGTVPSLYRIGDCVAPRRVTDAVYEGEVVGRDV